MPAATVNNTAAVNNGGPAKNFRPPRETSRGRSSAGEVRGPQGAPGAQQQRVNDRYVRIVARQLLFLFQKIAVLRIRIRIFLSPRIQIRILGYKFKEKST